MTSLSSNPAVLIWGFFLLVLTVIPLLVFALPALRNIPRRICIGLILSALICSIFLCSRAHESLYTGLDSSAYRLAGLAFSRGHALRSEDSTYSAFPKSARKWILFATKNGRTRDKSFRILSESNKTTPVFTCPWFLPTISMEATAISWLGLPDKWLVPIFASLWIFTVGALVYRVGKGRGILFLFSLLASSPFFAWFCRGFYSEAVGGMLVSSAALFALAFPGKWPELIAFACGLATAYHRSTGMIGYAVLAVLIATHGSKRETYRFILGAILGTGIAAILLICIANPYGKGFVGGTAAKHWGLYVGVPVCFVLTGISLIALHVQRIRIFFQHRSVKLLCKNIINVSCIAFLFIPFLVGGRECIGAVRVIHGLRIPGLIIFLGLIAVFMNYHHDFKWKAIFAVVLVCSTAVFFVSGAETSVGIWSYRRIVPLVLILSPLLAAGASRALENKQWFPRYTVPLFLVCAFWNSIENPAVYFGIEEVGAESHMKALTNAVCLDKQGALFDYFLDQAPLAATTQGRVLGVREWAYPHWGDVVDAWNSVWPDDPMVFVSSYTPPTLESNCHLVPISDVQTDISYVSSRILFPSEQIARRKRNIVLRPDPISFDSPLELRSQEKQMDGGPMGLRGKWSKSRNGGQWSQSCSGFIGPVARSESGEYLQVILDAKWYPPSALWSNQIVKISAPWGASAQTTVSFDSTKIITSLEGASAEWLTAHKSGTAVISISTPTPYDPSEYGLSGYPRDLGVFISRISARVIIHK